jgi:DNA-binding response OmpR family regulator
MEGQPLILIVDDSDRIARLTRMMLHYAGYQTSYASNGLEALACAEKIQPDLILLDYHMPEMDGLEVIRRLRAVGDRTPIIMVSATSPESVKRLHVESLGLGANDFIGKPFSFRELTGHVKAQLQRKGA